MCVCGGLPLGLDDEQYKAEQPREGLFLAGAMNCWEEFNRSIYWFLGEDHGVQIKMPLPWGWLVLFIGKGPGPLPKY